jgi:riboflavin biosynthesis pyrimidine reductase
MSESQRRRLSPLCDLWLFPEKSVPLDSVLTILHRDYAIRTLICEGGPSLFRSLLEAGAIDELRLTWCPLVFGGAGAPTLTGLPGDFLKTIRRARLKKMDTVGSECFLTYTF